MGSKGTTQEEKRRSNETTEDIVEEVVEPQEPPVQETQDSLEIKMVPSVQGPQDPTLELVEGDLDLEDQKAPDAKNEQMSRDVQEPQCSQAKKLKFNLSNKMKNSINRKGVKWVHLG